MQARVFRKQCACMQIVITVFTRSGSAIKPPNRQPGRAGNLIWAVLLNVVKDLLVNNLFSPIETKKRETFSAFLASDFEVLQSERLCQTLMNTTSSVLVAKAEGAFNSRPSALWTRKLLRRFAADNEAGWRATGFRETWPRFPFIAQPKTSDTTFFAATLTEKR